MNRFSPPPTSADPAFHHSNHRPPLPVSTMPNTPAGFEYPTFGGQQGPAQHQRYVLGSSVLLTAVLCLIFVIVLITVLHLYARNKLRRQQAQRRRARAHVHRSVHAAIAAGTVERPKTGLDPAVVAALPKFEYKKKIDQDQPEGAAAEDCSVCLSQMEEGEMVRRLPACGHSFHDNCIDMWLYSHNTCPLCRMVVGPIANDFHIAATPAPATVEVVVVARVGDSGGDDDISPRLLAAPQATSTQLLMPTLAGCSGGHGDSSHDEISEAPSRLAPFRRMFSLERAGIRRQRGDEGSPRDPEMHQLAGAIV